MTEHRTTGELYYSAIVTSDEITAAVDLFMRDPTASVFQFASGHSIDPSAEVGAHAWASYILRSPEMSDARRRAAVEVAILKARPKKT